MVLFTYYCGFCYKKKWRNEDCSAVIGILSCFFTVTADDCHAQCDTWNGCLSVLLNVTQKKVTSRALWFLMQVGKKISCHKHTLINLNLRHH